LPDAGLLRVNREPVAAAAGESENAADSEASEESGEAA
jgi:hypothetical protein